ncbi:MAG: glycosyltransferase [Synergistaceae bacterium]|nr:glycosyltransferase [Synergistaceae bacterium]
MNKLFAMLPCFNEELNISALIDSWITQRDSLSSKGYELQVCPIDDCSTDNTKAVIIQKQEQYPETVCPIFHKVNKSLGGGVNSSIAYFLEHGTNEDLMCLMDGDNSHDPKYVHSMLEKLKDGVECVIASRYQQGSKIFGVPFHRRLMSDMARIYYTIILGVPNVRDYTCGYRLYKYNAVKRLSEKFGEPIIQEKSFACMMEFLYKLYLSGTKFAETGFELRYDKKLGDSKMNVTSTARKSLSAALRLRKIRSKES